MNVTVTSPEASASPPPRRPGASSALPPRRLYRDPKGLIGGVASGFAEYFDVDPVIARLLWVVALLSGIGLPAYVLCWLIVPKAPSWPPPGYVGRSGGAASQSTTWLSGVVILALAAMIGSGLDGFGDYLLPAALVGFGVYLLNQRPLAASSDGAAEAAAIADVGSGAPAEPSPEPRGLVTPMVLSVLAIGAGTLVALGAAGVVHVSLATAAASGLALVGGGLVASLWLGRAPGLVPVGLGLIALLLSASTLERWVGGAAREVSESVHIQVNDAESTGLGSRTYVITSLDELGPRYEVGMGQVVLDLSQLDLTGQERSVELEVGLGEATVIVPRDVALEVRGEVGTGAASVLGREIGGVDTRIERDDAGAGAGKLRVDLEVGLGHAEVRRAL
jgi:phage shock protein PspC (stress-responsive transcriptional regulator)